MDKKPNKFAAGFSKWISGCKADRSKLLKSIVSLVLASVILVTCTFCWYFLKTAEGEANFSLDAGKGLRVNDTGTTQFSSAENDFALKPASSVDGRNLFFPTDGTDFSDVTKDMTFRSANAGDKNCNYIQIDFTLTAQANHTAIYINPDPTKTCLKVYNKEKDANGNEASAQNAAPLRMAVWASTPDKDTGAVAAPIVFNSQAKTITTAAVSDVDRASGAYISNGPQVAHQFSDYAYGGTPITTLSAGVETTFSVIVWLEGTDPKCRYDKISSINKNDIQLKLAFKTSWDNTEVIRFRDDSTNHWIQSLMNRESGSYSLNLRYTDTTVNPNETVDFNMYKYQQNDNEWTASIPGDMKEEITFILSPPTGSNDPTYIFCKSDGKDGGTAGTSSTTNRDVNRQYVVETSAGSDTSQCQGHWVALGDSDGGGVDIGDLDGDDF